MNNKEKLLTKSLLEYSKNLSDYGKVLNQLIENIENLNDLDVKIKNNIEAIDIIDPSIEIRPLNFDKIIKNVIEVTTEITNKIKLRIKNE